MSPRVMGRRRADAERQSGNLMFGTIGWLFADLMFALAMAFLVATTVGQPALSSPTDPVATSTPTPTPTLTPRSTPKPRPSPKFEKGLEATPVILKVKVDHQGLLRNDRTARTSLQKQLLAKKDLKGRQAGLVLAFGGAGNGNLGQATAIARKCNSALADLGDRGFVFRNTLFRPYINFGSPPNELTLHIFLFKQ